MFKLINIVVFVVLIIVNGQVEITKHNIMLTPTVNIPAPTKSLTPYPPLTRKVYLPVIIKGK